MKFRIFACLASVCCLLAGCEKISYISQTVVNNTGTSDTEENNLLFYKNIIEEYGKFSDLLISEKVKSVPDDVNFDAPDGSDEILSYDWGCMTAEMMTWSCQSTTKDTDYFGYALKDLNNDGNEELIMLTKDFDILSIFTTVNDKLKLVDAYWSRHRCAVYDSGTLYISSSSGAANSDNSIQEISSNSGQLVTLKEYGVDTDHYYKIINGDYSVISKSEIDEFHKTYPVLNYDNSRQINRDLGFEFIPMNRNA